MDRGSTVEGDLETRHGTLRDRGAPGEPGHSVLVGRRVLLHYEEKILHGRVAMPCALSEAHQKTLILLIDEYLETRQPVSSLSMSQKTGRSPATMRSWMAQMEELGYLSSVHTSSGRQPTPQTLAWYAQTLAPNPPALDLKPADWEILANLEHVGYNRDYVGQVLSDLCQCASLVFLSPQSMRIQAVQLCPLSGDKIMCVWHTMCQHTMYRIVDCQPFAAMLRVVGLEAVTNYLNACVHALTFEESLRHVAKVHTPLEHISQCILRHGYDTLEGKLDVKGHGYLLDSWPDKDSMAHCREVFSWLEATNHVTHVLQRAINHPDHQRWQIIWYHDHDTAYLPHCCILIAPYRAESQQGAVSVIGPLHMDYRRIIPIMKHMVHLVERSLQ